VNFGARIRRDYDLRDSAAVAQIEEDQIAKVATAVYPSHENDFGTGVGGAQVSTSVSAL
jgi:hypothetical protein